MSKNMQSLWSKNISMSKGVLHCSGISASALAAEFKTPTFFLDEDDFRTRALNWNTELSKAFGPQSGRVYYAAKAFICVEVARWIADLGIGIDVCTGGELAVALNGGIDPQKIEVHGNNKSVAEIDPKVTKVLSLGKQDMKIEDEVIPVNDAANLPVKNLFPTQAQIGLKDSIGFLAFILPENAKNALSGKADFKGERILTANNKYILDGHHRWSQTYLMNPDATIPALDLTLNVKDSSSRI